MNDDGIREVLDFWFADGREADWFKPSAAFDRAVAQHLATWHERAVAGDLETWQASAAGSLALCILLDQAPRQLFRGTGRAFATDARALAVTARALEEGLDRELTPEQRQFLYMPLMHSERLADHERCVALYQAPELRDKLEHAVAHAEILRRFGRFPHRNAALGRESSAEEEAYLAASGRDFGQAPLAADTGR